MKICKYLLAIHANIGANFESNQGSSGEVGIIWKSEWSFQGVYYWLCYCPREKNEIPPLKREGKGEIMWNFTKILVLPSPSICHILKWFDTLLFSKSDFLGLVDFIKWIKTS